MQNLQQQLQQQLQVWLRLTIIFLITNLSLERIDLRFNHLLVIL